LAKAKLSAKIDLDKTLRKHSHQNHNYSLLQELKTV